MRMLGNIITSTACLWHMHATSSTLILHTPPTTDCTNSSPTGGFSPHLLPLLTPSHLSSPPTPPHPTLSSSHLIPPHPTPSSPHPSSPYPTSPHLPPPLHPTTPHPIPSSPCPILTSPHPILISSHLLTPGPGRHGEP